MRFGFRAFAPRGGAAMLSLGFTCLAILLSACVLVHRDALSETTGAAGSPQTSNPTEALAPYPVNFWTLDVVDDTHAFVTASLDADWWLLRTEDGGKTWAKIALPASVAELHFVTARLGWLLTSGCTATDGKLSAATCRAAILRTTDGGETWTELVERSAPGFGSGPFSSLRFVDERNGWVLERGGLCKPVVCVNVLRTTDGGRSWSVMTKAPLRLSMLVAVDDSHLWGFGADGILFSGDGGATWASQLDLRSVPSWPPTIRGLDFVDPRHGWALLFDSASCTASSCSGYALYATDDGGAHWSVRASGDAFGGCRGQLTTPRFTSPSVGWIGVNNGAGGAGTRFGVLVSADGGASWTCHSAPIAFDTVAPLDADRAWAIGERGAQSLLLSTDSAGASWTEAFPQPNMPAAPPIPAAHSTIVAGSLAPKLAGDGVLATETALWRVTALAVGSDGDLFIGETTGCAKAQHCGSRVRRVDAHTGLIEVVAGTGQPGYDSENKPCCRGSGEDATTTYLGLVNALALDRAGRLYVGASDALANGMVWRIDLRTKRIDLIAGGPGGSAAQDPRGGDGGPATHATLFGVWSLAIDDAGEVFIGEGGGYRIRQVSPNGAIRTIAGTAALTGYADPGHPGTETPMYGPSALALAPDGSLYYAEGTANRVRRLDASGMVHALAGTGEIGVSGDGGPATLARLDQPRALALDDQGRLYIAGSSAVRRVERDGSIRTVWPRADDVSSVSAMAIGPDGALYVADARYPLVRRIVFSE